MERNMSIESKRIMQSLEGMLEITLGDVHQPYGKIKRGEAGKVSWRR
jgi:hypothetical protein